MNGSRYKFSKHSESELNEFLKAVAHQTPPTISPNIKLWEKLLPVDESLQQRINSFRTPTTEVIDITGTDDEKDATEGESRKVQQEVKFLLPDESFTQLTASESNLNTTAVGDLIEGVQELLQTEPILPEDIIRQFGSEYPLQMLQETFILFASELNSECILKLWKSIARVNFKEQNSVAGCFLQYILVPKIMQKDDAAVKVLITEVFSTFRDELIAVLQKLLLAPNHDSDLTILRSNLGALPEKYKNIILRIFKENRTKLEPYHLGTLLSLISMHTDSENLSTVVELMFNAAKDFAREKMFGKLLLEVLQILGSSVPQKEPQLRHIISVHKSVFKNQIVKVFENSLMDHKMLSQSFKV